MPPSTSCAGNTELEEWESDVMYKCSICGGSSFRSAPGRERRSCISCDAMERHRYMFGILSRIVPGKRVLDVAPLSPLIWKECLLSVGASLCVSVDRWRGGNPLDPRDVSFADVFCDVTDLATEFDPSSFDVVVMQQVLDEVLDYRAAIASVARVLKEGGVAYVEVKAYTDIDGAEPDGNRKFGNHWKFGRDHLASVLRLSFSSVEPMEYVECGWHGQVFVCKK